MKRRKRAPSGYLRALRVLYADDLGILRRHLREAVANGDEQLARELTRRIAEVSEAHRGGES